MGSIARALTQEPHFGVMDEPTANPGLGNQMRVHQQVRLLVRQGMGVMMPSHVSDHAFSCCSKAAILGAERLFHDRGCGIGASDQNIVMRLLSRDGIDPVKEVKYKVADAAASVLALQSGEIQGALLSDQFIQKFLDDGTLRVVRTITHDPDFKDEACCIHAVNLDLYENNPITVKKLTRAHEKAKEWIMAHREEAVKLLQENNWASGDPDLVLKIFSTFNYDLTDAATEDTLNKVIEDYKSYGLLKKDVPTEDILNKVWDPVLRGQK